MHRDTSLGKLQINGDFRKTPVFSRCYGHQHLTTVVFNVIMVVTVTTEPMFSIF